MRIINVTGHSGSGKTTFIRDLVPELTKSGPVATIKHLGHHVYALEAGKDTTLFHEAGASISAGIDCGKTVFISRTTDLTEILDYFCDHGMMYAVIEGFKTLNLPSIVIGDLQAVHVLFRNPDPETVLGDISVFPEYSTKKGLEDKVLTQWNSNNKDNVSDRPISLTMAALVDLCGIDGSIANKTLSTMCRDISDELSRADRNAATGFSVRAWYLFGGKQELYGSVATPGHESAFNLISRGMTLLQERCREEGIGISIEGW